ncbi:MAG: hypothetical protein KJO07_17150 [Deltaproteobacteria bacterium]|nr:hypothetical protein [Deltaproteobacteria bacterium]
MGLKPRSDRVTVLNVNVPGYQSTVDGHKYRDMKRALLKVLPRTGGLTQTEMMTGVKPHLSEELFPGGAKSGWWVKCVQLDLEARGRMRRDTSGKRIRWTRS